MFKKVLKAAFLGRPRGVNKGVKKYVSGVFYFFFYGKLNRIIVRTANVSSASAVWRLEVLAFTRE